MKNVEIYDIFLLNLIAVAKCRLQNGYLRFLKQLFIGRSRWPFFLSFVYS